jgi:RNA 3'-terminal phosphate cyclase (ATP)
LIYIDGSYGEGGGQIIRNSVALSVLFNTEINVTNIRANRPNKGIKPQHYTAIEIIKSISNAKTNGLHVGSSDLSFSPFNIKEGSYQFDIGTAGSIVLVFQACILAFLNSDVTISITLKGGTDVKWAPSWDYFEKVFLPLIKKMGISISSKLLKRGYYPKGGGKASITIFPCNKIKPLSINEKQYFKNIEGIINISNLPENISSRMKNSAIKKIIENDYEASLKIDSNNSLSSGTGITLWSESKDTILGKTIIGERGISAEKIGYNAADSIIEEIQSKASIDINMIDQIIPYMFLSDNNKPSQCSIKNLSGHTKTNIWLLNRFIDNEKNIEILYDKNLINIKVNGINFI